MNKIILFTREEKGVLKRLLLFYRKARKEHEIGSIRNAHVALRGLAGAISLYPPILGTQHLGSGSRSIETLIDMLCMKEDPDLILHIPTKALVGKGFLIAKINFFFMLYYLAGESGEMKDHQPAIKNIVSGNIFTLMAEEVYLAIIDDRSNSMHVRSNAAYLLANIWEYRLDHGIREFAPLLSSLWRARERLTPSFGTLLGFSELFKIAESVDPLWLKFIQNFEVTGEEIFSLEEFLFGLSFEEIGRLRGEMERTGRSSLGREEVCQIIGERSVYPRYDMDDPRETYRSFRHRLISAKVRKKVKTPGPRKTFEEHIICYLLSRPEE